MRSCYAIFVSLLLWSLCATAADPQSAKLSSPQATGGSWVQEATLTNTVGCCDNARAVAIGGNTVGVSPVGGSVFVYVKPASGWHSRLDRTSPRGRFTYSSNLRVDGPT
jgi:hypothetical protein